MEQEDVILAPPLDPNAYYRSWTEEGINYTTIAVSVTVIIAAELRKALTILQ